MVVSAPSPSDDAVAVSSANHYAILAKLATGGMAELFLARTTSTGGVERYVVLKRVLPDKLADRDFVTMFLDEARLVAQLQHPNIAQVFDTGRLGESYFFSMEYVHGEDLGRLVASATDSGVPISLDAALTFASGLCAGLHYAHEKVGTDGRPLHVVHRDVSPSNVLVSYDGAVKLVDFGIARAGSSPSTSKHGLKGKIAYMSPEQCQGLATLDRRSDLFSVGSILYELTTGRPPFVGETEYGVLNQIVTRDAEPPSTWVPGYPPALEAIVMRALARDPERRVRTALELQTQLEDFAHDSRLRISPLVLARLMSGLFPARLEEWAHAKAQGAFFVEQHVVQTLIDSGKTPDPNDPQTRAQIKAMAAQLGIEDPTAIIHLPLDLDEAATTTAHRAQHHQQGYRPSHSGTMVSHPQSAATAHADRGAGPDRVAVARLASPTKFINRPRRRNKILGGVAIVAIAGGIAALIAAGGGSAAALAPEAPAVKEVPEVPEVPEVVADPSPPPPTVLVTPAAQPVAPDAGAPVEVPVNKPAPVAQLHVAKPVGKKITRPKRRPVAPSKSEDKTWDAESPFMPVRTGKH